MIARKARSGLLAAAAVIAVLPFLDGCRFNGGFSSFDNLKVEQTSNARIAYLVMKGEEGEPAITGKAVVGGKGSADIVADGGHASMTPDFKNIEPQSDLPIAYTSPELYGGPDSSIMVQRQAGLNEANDTFLTYHETHDLAGTMYARGYAGTRTDANVIDGLRQKSTTLRRATYNGTGFVNVGQGKHAYEIDGDLVLTANFFDPDGKDALFGSITDTSITSPTADNPDAVNQITFKGDFEPGTSDYTIQNNFQLNSTSGKSTANPSGTFAKIDDGSGIGSFFGSKAQGTMGVFAGAGITTSYAKEEGYRTQVIGSFAGKAAKDP